MKLAATGDALDLMHVEGHRALGTVGRENRGSSARDIGPHRPPNAVKTRATHAVAVTKSSYSAIWRLISLGSSWLRSQAYFTAPRSMTAKLSPSSQAKSRYCSTSTIAMLPRLRRYEIARPMSLMIDGWIPSVGSS